MELNRFSRMVISHLNSSFGRKCKESGISKEGISFLRNFAVTWTKYKGHRKRMRKHLWADSGEPQIRGSWAETGIPRRHGRGQSTQAFWFGVPGIQHNHSCPCPVPLRKTYSWLHPPLPHDRGSLNSQLLLPLLEILSVSQHKGSLTFCGFIGHTVV